MSQSSSSSQDPFFPGAIVYPDEGNDTFSYHPHEDPWINQILGNYRLLQRIGEGATAIVYRAQHVQLESIYAIKILHPMIATRPGMRERFLREARTVAQLKHENIILIHDFAIDPQLGPYMVMEYLQGHTLKDVLQIQGPQSLPLVLAISLQICNALITAHQAGIIHRDLKPENIFLEQRDLAPPRVKILDFGIARLTQNTSSITGDGKLIGTPLYMSPEQCRGQFPLTPASDIYSFGIMLYEMLMGHPPFQSESPHKLIIDHFLATPPDLDFSFSEDLRQLQRELLAKEPTERPQDFGVLAKRLRESMEQTQAGSKFPIHSTLEDEPLPHFSTTPSPMIPLIPQGPLPVQATALYHPAAPDSRELPGVLSPVSFDSSPMYIQSPSTLSSVYPVSSTPALSTSPVPFPPQEGQTHEQLPQIRSKNTNTPEHRKKTSTQIPMSPPPETASPVVVKRGSTSGMESFPPSSDPLINDLEQLFATPDPEKPQSPSLSATAWDVSLPPTQTKDSTYLPQENSYPMSIVEQSRRMEEVARSPFFQVNSSIAKTPPKSMLAIPPQTPVPGRNAVQTPVPPQTGTHKPPALSTSSSYPHALEDDLLQSLSPFSNDVTKIASGPYVPSAHPPLSPSSSIPVFAPRQQRQTGSYPDAPSSSGHAMTPEELEQVLFHQDAVTEIDLSRSPLRKPRRRVSRRTHLWVWMLLLCALGAGFYVLYLLSQIPLLPPLLSR